MEIKPRHYQERALKVLKTVKGREDKSAIVQMASGLGKTYFSAFESLNYKGKILFVCHRTEILRQARKTFTTLNKQHSITKKMGYFHGDKKDEEYDILFASVQSLGREKNIEKFNKKEFDFIIIDEYHHALAPTYKRIIKHFKPKFWLGITATPYRMDDGEGEQLKKLLNADIVFKHTLFEGIEDGDLSPFNLVFHKDNIDYSKIRFNGYSYTEKDLNKALLIKERDKAIITEYKRHFKNRRCIGFCVSVKHVDRMVKLFTKHGVKTDSITYKTNFTKRKQIEKDFRDGDIDILFTRDIYNEGIDIPEVDGILLLRPTWSKVVFFQQIGRGLRISKNKKDVIILDFVGNYKNAYMHHEWLSKGVKTGDRERIEKPTYEYPTGCKVHFTKEILDLFELSRPRTKRDIEELYLEYKRKFGKIPTSKEFRAYSSTYKKFYAENYGGWEKFLKVFGDKPYWKEINPTKKELVDNYLKVVKKLGKKKVGIQGIQLNKKLGSKYSYRQYIKVFGGFKNFKKYLKQNKLI